MALASFELKVPFERLGLTDWEGWQLATFVDVGNVWLINEEIETDSTRLGTDPPLRWSTGVGFRRSTVIGPVQFDLGLNPSPLTYRGEVPAETLFFGLLPNPIPIPIRLHLSLGAL